MKRHILSLSDLGVLTKNGAQAHVQLGKPIAKLVQATPAPVTEAKQEKRSKYRNKKAEHAGMTFDSARELARWLELLALEKAGRIRNLKRQVTFELAPSVDLGEKRRKPALRYQADFTYESEAGGRVVEDAKGMQTKEYRIKKHLMMSVHGILIREV